ncbi:MAG: aromatic ring-hydroxylating dioxygenase subunit alpha [Pseudomonadota bacterium]
MTEKFVIRGDATRPPEELIEAYNRGMRNYWHPVAREIDVPADKPVAVRLLDEEVLLCRLDGSVRALSNICRHFQARLSDGTLEHGCSRFKGDFVRCSYHGWAFAGDGACVDIPQLPPERQIPPAARIDSYLVDVRFGLIWVCLSKEPKSPLPDFPECQAEGMHATPMQYSQPWPASVFRMVQSALDDYHFPWLHEGILGNRNQPMPPTRNITTSDHRVISKFTTEQPANVTNAQEQNSPDNALEKSTVDYEMVVDLPNIIRLIKRNEGGTYVVCFFPTPIAFNETGIFWQVVRSYGLGSEEEKRIVELETLIQNQDKDHVGRQKMWTMRPFPIAGADDAIMAYLKGLSDLDLPSNL